MSKIDWAKGQLITLNPGDTATCSGGLNRGQIYALFFYNYAYNDSNATVTITGNNSMPPVTLTVPGTTAGEGLAAICFVSGDDTATIAASIVGQQPGATVQAFIGSAKMPIDTSGINNTLLNMDGSAQPFNKFTRYFGVPQSHWYSATITSNINSFISVQFSENKATVIVVNAPSSISNVIAYYGTLAQPLVTINSVSYQTYTWNLQGNGSQFIWINADSCQDSNTASISLQSLQALY